MKKDRLEDLSNYTMVILVANGAYATHYGFTADEWLRTRKLVKEVPNLVELNKKLIRTPQNISWERPKK